MAFEGFHVYIQFVIVKMDRTLNANNNKCDTIATATAITTCMVKYF